MRIVLWGLLVLGCGGTDETGLGLGSEGNLGGVCEEKADCVEAIKIEQETNGNALCQPTLLSPDAGVCMFSCDVLIAPFDPIPKAVAKCAELGGECRYPASQPPRTCQFD